MELILFKNREDHLPAKVIPFTARHGYSWHVYLPGVGPRQLYAFRVHGPFEPEKGFRFNGAKTLIDPYARAIVSPDLAREFWQKRTKVSNFLKHADRDAKFHISLEEVDTVDLLILALGSYDDLLKDDLGAEGIVFWLYYCVDSGIKEVLPPKLQAIAAELKELDCEGRLNLCSKLLHKVNERA